MGKQKTIEPKVESKVEPKSVELSTNEVLMIILKKFNDVALVLECQHNVLAKQEALLDKIAKQLPKRESCT